MAFENNDGTWLALGALALAVGAAAVARGSRSTLTMTLDNGDPLDVPFESIEAASRKPPAAATSLGGVLVKGQIAPGDYDTYKAWVQGSRAATQQTEVITMGAAQDDGQWFFWMDVPDNLAGWGVYSKTEDHGTKRKALAAVKRAKDWLVGEGRTVKVQR